MRIKTENYEIEFRIEDINLETKEIYPLNLTEFDYIIVEPNYTFLFVYDMNIIDETIGFGIIEATEEELKIFNKLIKY